MRSLLMVPSRKVFTFGGLLMLFLLLAITAFVYIRQGSAYGLPYTDDFKHGRGTGWTAYGGTWQIADGAMQNVSDERGAKLLSGSAYWTDYSVEADLRLDGDSGDAGLLLRVQQPEEGVDAFQGFYTGLRLRDNALIAGDADYGWTELTPTPLSDTLEPFQWYHLRATVTGCHLSVKASKISGGLLALIDAEVPSCSRRGQIGLRSYGSGGSWRWVRVTAVKPDLRGANQ